ncbi:MAG: pilus assembly protein PilZ, partial [Pseudomonadales bacterium RIFCSPLOWO2_12_59_9]
MDDRRQRSRHHAELQLEVFDMNSGESLGRVVDLTDDGFMLFSETAVSADSVWDLRLVCANPIGNIREIRLGAD